MNRQRRAALVALLAAAASAWSTQWALAAPAQAEQARIDRLIDAVARRQDARFVRNGKAYSAADAASFLREKLKANAAKVKTAQDFIEQVASRSSTTGQPYLIRFADGRELAAAEFLRAELAKQP